MGTSTRIDDTAKYIANTRDEIQAKADALAIVEAWNLRVRERRPLFFSPTLGGAPVSGRARVRRVQSLRSKRVCNVMQTVQRDVILSTPITSTTGITEIKIIGVAHFGHGVSVIGD
jgi:hypothetical protein